MWKRDPTPRRRLAIGAMYYLWVIKPQPTHCKNLIICFSEGSLIKPTPQVAHAKVRKPLFTSMGTSTRLQISPIYISILINMRSRHRVQSPVPSWAFVAAAASCLFSRTCALIAPCAHTNIILTHLCNAYARVMFKHA